MFDHNFNNVGLYHFPPYPLPSPFPLSASLCSFPPRFINLSSLHRVLHFHVPPHSLSPSTCHLQPTWPSPASHHSSSSFIPGQCCVFISHLAIVTISTSHPINLPHVSMYHLSLARPCRKAYPISFPGFSLLRHQFEHGSQPETSFVHSSPQMLPGSSASKIVFSVHNSHSLMARPYSVPRFGFTKRTFC